MWKHYFLTAWRNLKANRLYSLLNITGLAVGLVTGIMLLFWVQNEFSFDKFHHQAKDIYKISSKVDPEGAPWSGAPGPLAIIAQKMPTIKTLVRVLPVNHQQLSTVDHEKNLSDNNLAFVDSTFFNVFDFNVIYGSKEKFLPDANSIALTASTAKRLFGKENAVGNMIIYDTKLFRVSAIMQDFPQNSSLVYDGLLPMAYHGQEFTANGGNGNWKTIDEDYGDFNMQTYVVLSPKANPMAIGAELSDAYFLSKDGTNSQKQQLYLLQNLEDIHLISADGNTSALMMVRIMLLVAILILVIASINYINLSTARYMIRVKEISMRKIIGAKKSQLFLQFIMESTVLFFFAVLIAIGLMMILAPLYNNISGMHLSLWTLDKGTLLNIGLAIIGTLLLCSVYPAILLSSFKPISAIKGSTAKGGKSAVLRKSLVVFQFCVSFVLLIGMMVIWKQMRFMQKKDLGYNKEHVFTVSLSDEYADKIETMKKELSHSTAIEAIGESNEPDVTNIWSSTGDIDWKNKPENKQLIITQMTVDKDFIPLMKYQFLEGSNFTGMPSDSSYFILNETMVKQMGLKAPYVGQTIEFHGHSGAIKGILKDFNFKPLTEAITPILLFTYWGKSSLYFRATGANMQQALREVAKAYQHNAPHTPFDYKFLDKNIENQYRSQQHTGTLFTIFASIAMLISCLGLFGLSTYTAQTRTNEIGIRKVLGASVVNIVALISRNFILLVGISVLAAAPLAYFLMHRWLNNFAYKTSIDLFTFILGAFLLLFIAFGTISYITLKAAKANPVKSLKAE